MGVERSLEAVVCKAKINIINRSGSCTVASVSLWLKRGPKHSLHTTNLACPLSPFRKISF